MRLKLIPISLLLPLISLISACTPADPSSNSPIDEEVVAVVESESGAPEFQILVPANDLHIGEPRIPFIIRDGPNMVREVSQVFLTVLDINEQPFTVVWEGSAVNYSDYTVPYWVIRPNIETAGNYGIRANILEADGTTSEAQFAVAILEDSIAPSVGDAGIPSESRTAFDAETIKEISSDFQDPDPDLYTMTVTEALNNGRPTVISFSTPAYCSTVFCAPVLQSVKDVKAENSDEFDFLHIEIFADFQELVTDQTVLDWKLQSEPWTYILDADGIVTARLAGPVSAGELTDQLEIAVEK